LRYFFRRHFPPGHRILLIESGSRHLIESVIPSLHSMLGEPLEIDLVTCYPGVPRGVNGRVIRVTDYGGAAGRSQLWKDLSDRDYPVAGLICSAEPIMTKWKWWLGAKLKSKVLIINENGDYFWLDWAHRGLICQFAGYRAGLSGSAAVPALIRFLLFPLTLAYLILYAFTVHARRKIRILLQP
jgi:hypothetical protein